MIPLPVDPGSIRADLEALYGDLDAEIRRRSPVCELSGRCCRFREYDHTLFVSAAEAALLLADAPRPSRPLDDGDTCPWQDASGRCTAREARPLGCRVYFCDPTYEAEMPVVAEAYVARLKAIVDRHGLPWDYAPLHVHLRRARDESRWASDAHAPAASTQGHDNI